MKVALLVNDRTSREALARRIAEWGGAVDQYPTAAKAIDMLGATRYDLVVMHWQVYPGPKHPRTQIAKEIQNPNSKRSKGNSAAECASCRFSNGYNPQGVSGLGIWGFLGYLGVWVLGCFPAFLHS